MLMIGAFLYETPPSLPELKVLIGEALSERLLTGRNGPNAPERLLGCALLQKLLPSGCDLRDLQRDSHERPFLVNMEGYLDFSISHTAKTVVCALMTDPGAARVGIDAETLTGDLRERAERIAARWFSEGERAVFAADPREETFLSIWTAKEATVKWTGMGLCELPQIDTSREPILLSDGKTVAVRHYRIRDTLIALCTAAGTETPEEITVFRRLSELDKR